MTALRLVHSVSAVADESCCGPYAEHQADCHPITVLEDPAGWSA